MAARLGRTVEQLEREMTFPEFLEWMVFLRLEKGEDRNDSWGKFKAGMMAVVERQRGRH